jgi:hypothetical protein
MHLLAVSPDTSLPAPEHIVLDMPALSAELQYTRQQQQQQASGIGCKQFNCIHIHGWVVLYKVLNFLLCGHSSSQLAAEPWHAL